ncbi:MAG: sporulation transcriptional regulator SpoIIID [Clostridia bacterium]|nr:sporulation transcriptional regulator SpoIIID [Clostridia bacterium]
MIYFSNIEERCEKMARYLIDNKTTVRETAKKFGISKSTVHKDITDKLYKINLFLYNEVAKILEVNKKERHLRGGEATKRKYLIEKNADNT